MIANRVGINFTKNSGLFMYVARNLLPSKMAVSVQCTALHRILTVFHQKFTDQS